MVLGNYISVGKAGLWHNGSRANIPGVSDRPAPEQVYELLKCSYPKFFKMDPLCKWAFLGAEYLLANDTMFSTLDKSKVALVITTAHGCLDVDKRFHAGMDMPSPALFVYTLPNIMLGEICIRHGFKGEQLCMVSDSFDAAGLYFAAQDLITAQGMQGCICGWVDACDGDYNVFLASAIANGPGALFTPALLQQLYTTHNGQNTAR